MPGEHADSKAVRKEWVTYEAPNAVQQFLETLFTQMRLAGISKPIANLTCGVCGTEIEGEEISLGLLFVRASLNIKDILGLQEAAISQSVSTSWQNVRPHDLAHFDITVLRKVLEILRENILGWTPGYYEHPLLIFTYGENDPAHDIRLLGVYIFSCNPHEFEIGCAYLALSQQSRLAIWVKPYSTIRFYYDGQFLGHVLRLRDTNSWALRSFQHLLRKFLAFDAGVDQQRIPPVLSDYANVLLLSTMLVSEEKKGAAFHIIRKEQFEEANFVSGVRHSMSGPTFNISKMPLGEILTYLRQDGAVVIDYDGNLLGVGVYFKSPGGRKESARDIARKHNGHVLLVSQDGGLYFYSQAIRSQFRTPPPGKTPNEYPVARLDFYPIGEIAFI